MMSGRDADAPLKSEMPWEKAMWHLPLSDLDRAMVGRRIGFWQDWLERDSLDEFWQSLQMTGTYDAIQIPTFNVSGWYDGRLKGQVAAYLGIMRSTRNPTDHVLLIGPWLHSPMGQAPKFAMRDFGPQGDLDVDAVRLRWLEHVVKGNPRQSVTGALYFLQVANEWRQASAWPIPGTSFTKYYLDSAGGANTWHGDGFLRTDHAGEGPDDRFVYDPAKPVPTNWSPTRANGILPTEPQDNRGIEERPDVLVYSTPQLASEMEVTGPLTATIYFSTDVPDTDITVKLLEVDADGVAYQLSYGIARARYRQSYAEPRLLEPGQVYAVNIELQPTSNYFKAGHRIRVEVSSSNFPFYARNLNTGANNNTTTEMRVAHTRIVHSPEHPSHIVLPIVPAGSTQTVHFDEHRRA
jgi:putative CocE/NonD family hydrolase